jgi:hypothetical protein
MGHVGRGWPEVVHEPTGRQDETHFISASSGGSPVTPETRLQKRSVQEALVDGASKKFLSLSVPPRRLPTGKALVIRHKQ